MPSRAYIYERSIPIPHVGCWLWLLSPGSHGYGQAWNGATITTAHRMAYEAFVGPIPGKMLVQHSCDSKWCVNPDHLSLGTDASNAEDKRRKGRAAKKLTPSDRQDVIFKYQTGCFTQRQLARIFGVTQRAIWMVLQTHSQPQPNSEEDEGDPSSATFHCPPTTTPGRTSGH